MATGVQVWAHQFSQGVANGVVETIGVAGGLGKIRLSCTALIKPTHRNTSIAQGMGNVLEIKTPALFA